MKFRLQTKYTLAITALILSVFGIEFVTHDWQVHRRAVQLGPASPVEFNRILSKLLVEDGRRLATILAVELGPLVVAGDRNRVEELLATALLYRGDTIAYAVVTDRQGHSYRGRPAMRDQRPAPSTIEESGPLELTIPVTHGKEQVGILRIGLSLASVETSVRALERKMQAEQVARRKEYDQLAVVLVIVLALGGVFLGGVTARRLSLPIRALARSARGFAEGNLSAPLPPAKGNDEIAELTKAFEGMRESLARTTVSRDFLHRIIDSLNEGLIVTDAGGRIRLTNRAVSEMFGYSSEELKGTRFVDLMEGSKAYTAHSDGTKGGECCLAHRDGFLMPVEVSRSIFFEGDTTEQVYVISDIAARKEMEDELATYRSRLEQLVVERTKELTAALQELESFSYSVSHDLHAPLRAINGFGAALYEDYYPHMDETCRGYLNRIRLATVRMGQLIDGLLTLARVTRSEIHDEMVDLSAIASEVAADLSSSDPPRQATFRIAPKLLVRSDPSHMRLLLQNLFGNAWKFTRDQSSAVIELGQLELNGGRVYFVRDNGAGFDPVYANGLFRPFHRLHDDDEFPGTGIGLATVQRIVRRHGGQVWAEAEAGFGATFYFTLPTPQFSDQVEETRVSSRAPLSNRTNSQRPSKTA